MPTQKGASTASRPGSARTSVLSKAMSHNSSISRQSSRDSIGGLDSSRRRSVGPAASKGTSSSTTRRASTACGSRPTSAAAKESAKDRVTVAVRKRPAKDDEVDVVNANDLSYIEVCEPKKKVDLKEYVEKHQFQFDYAFDESHDNEYVYRCTARPLVPFVCNGGLATCFAFGQTGSGKTHTMLGSPHNGIPGLYVLASQDIFRAIDQQSDSYRHLCELMEIYGDEVYDLLSANKQRLVPREDAKKKVQIQGLVQRPVSDIEELMYAIESGSTQRSTSMTGMNEASSRSHAILQISIKTLTGKLHGQLSFIDLAGSEKGSDTAENVKKTRMEGAEINKSLLALKECIRAMNDPSANYTPFRSSKLTQVMIHVSGQGGECVHPDLVCRSACTRAHSDVFTGICKSMHPPMHTIRIQKYTFVANPRFQKADDKSLMLATAKQVLKESFIGNGRTVMIANISPSSYSCLETVNTLRYLHPTILQIMHAINLVSDFVN